MTNFKILDLSFAGVTKRLYLMILGTIILGFMNQWVLATLWSFTLSVSFILGVSMKTGKEQILNAEEAKIISLRKNKDLDKTA